MPDNIIDTLEQAGFRHRSSLAGPHTMVFQESHVPWFQSITIIQQLMHGTIDLVCPALVDLVDLEMTPAVQKDKATSKETLVSPFPPEEHTEKQPSSSFSYSFMSKPQQVNMTSKVQTSDPHMDVKRPASKSSAKNQYTWIKEAHQKQDHINHELSGACMQSSDEALVARYMALASSFTFWKAYDKSRSFQTLGSYYLPYYYQGASAQPEKSSQFPNVSLTIDQEGRTTKYTIVNQLGVGGLGCVYKIKNVATHQIYAMKAP